MIILDRYIMSQFLKGMLPVLLLLLALFSLLTLAEELEDVGQGTFTQLDAFLVGERNFSTKRVQTLINRMRSSGAQKSLKEFFGGSA